MSKTADRWSAFGVLVVGLAAAVLLLAAGMKIGKADQAEAPDIDLSVASLNGYASIETTRVAKMAHLMLGMGGEFTAQTKAVYNSVTDKVEAEYTINWRRKDSEVELVSDNDDPAWKTVTIFSKTWSGSNWGECIGEMMKWRGGN